MSRRPFRSLSRVGAGLLAFMLVLVSCDTSPELRVARELDAGNAQDYEDRAEHRYNVSIKQTVTAEGISTAPPKQVSLDAILVEKINAPKGGRPTISIEIVEVSAQGEDAEAEAAAARGRTATMRPTPEGFDLELPGEALGNNGEIRAADILLLAHLLTPVKPTRHLLRRGSYADNATVPTAWASEALDIEGSAQIEDRTRQMGRRVLEISGLHRAQATLSIPVIENAKEVADGAEPKLNLYFTNLMKEALGEEGENPVAALALLPATIADIFLFGFTCVFSLGFAPGCSDLDKDEAALVKLSGPLEIEQDAIVHTSTGLNLTTESTASATLSGNLPRPPEGERLSAHAAKLAGAQMKLDFEWQITSALEGEWPQDRAGSWVPFAIAIAVGLLAIGLLVSLFSRRKRSNDSSPTKEVAAK